MDHQVSLVIIQYGDLHHLRTCLVSLANHPDQSLFREIIIINNDPICPESALGSITKDVGLANVVTVNNSDTSYSSGINLGAHIARSPWLCLANNDIFWRKHTSLQPLLDVLAKGQAQVVGPQLEYPDGSWQRSCGIFPSIKAEFLALLFADSLSNLWKKLTSKHQNLNNSLREVEYVDGALMMMSSRTFHDLGGFDDNFRFYAEDADFCMRARKKGLSMKLASSARIAHVRGGSSTAQDISRYAQRLCAAKRAFVQKHFGSEYVKLYSTIQKVVAWERCTILGILSQLFPTERLRATHTYFRALRNSA